MTEMKKFKSAIILLILLFNMPGLNAQQSAIIRGRVIDSEDKMAIIGATVAEYDSENRVINGTITSVDGDFVYTMKDASNTVRVSVIGYAAKEIEVQPGKTVIVELSTEAIKIEDVQIVAQAADYSSLTNIADRDKASSSTKVDLTDMIDGAVSSATDALQGQVSGLDIVMNSGDPGSGSQMVIRGLSSMGGSRPLIVIDGIRQNRVGNDFDLSSADSEDISNMINIPIQDIKSIEVLKDAASTAVYGSQGADGVLLIETFKGRMGDVKFDYQYKVYLDIQPPPMPMLDGDEYIMLQLEQWHSRDGIFAIPPEIGYDRDYVDFYNYSQNTDWIGEVTQNGVQQEHYFSISGGAEKTRYRTSFNYQDQTGTTINTGFRRFITRTNLDYFLSRNLLFQVKFTYSSSTTDKNFRVSGKNIREMAYLKAPNMSVFKYDADGNNTGEYFTPIESYQGDGVKYYNPVAIARLGENKQNDDNFQNSFMLRYKINNWFTVRETVSFQYNGRKSNEFYPSSAIGADWLSNDINNSTEGNNASLSIASESQLAFGGPLFNENHEISGAITWITDQSTANSISITGVKTPSVNITDPSVNALIGETKTGFRETRMMRGVNNLNYKAFDRYLLSGVFTLDAHSAFGANNRWGIFYGISGGWRFSSEPFMESFNWLGESKIYANYGVSGNRPNEPYVRFAQYVTPSQGQYIYNPAVEPQNVALDNLRWSKVGSYEVGMELNLFRNKVYLQMAYYEKVTRDILFDKYDIPYSSGFNQLRYFNGGMLTNVGWELSGSYRVINSNDWSWNLNLNTTQNRNVFNELPDNFNKENSTSINNEQYPRRVKEGEPIGSFFGFRYEGVWASDEEVVARDKAGNVIVDGDGNPIPFTYTGTYTFKGGDPKYADLNNDGVIDLNDVEYLGDSNPDFMGGFGSNLKYKSFNLSVSFHYRLGFDIVNGVAMQTQGMRTRDNQSKAVLHRWRVQGQNEEGMLPRAYMSHPASNLGSDRFVEPGDYLRLNDVKLSYRLSNNICQKIGVSSASITLSSRKLYTFTYYSGQDPEISQKSDPFWMGVDNAETPPPRTFTATVSVGF